MIAHLSRDLHTARSGSTPMHIVFVYDPAFSPAVRLDIYPADSFRPVKWWFARSLLRDGLKGAAGEGDVRVTTSEVLDTTTIRLSSPSGTIWLDFDPAELSDALAVTELMCPFDAEEVDVDQLLEELMA